MSLGLQINKELVGNLMILLTDHCRPLYHTKLLKLLFLIDQEATKIKGTPITWLDYKAWQLGPVAPPVYYSKNQGQNSFYEFVKFEKTGDKNSCIVKPVKKFDDSEFSDWDMDIIMDIIQKYGKRSNAELIQLTHKEGSLWSNAINESHIKFNQSNKISDKSLNFLELIEGDDYKKSIYYSTLENLELKSTL